MLGAYVGVIVLAATGDFWIALAVASPVIARRRRHLSDDLRRLGRDPLTTHLATFGFLILQNYALWFGPRRDPGALTGHSPSLPDYPWYWLVIALLSAAIIGGLRPSSPGTYGSDPRRRRTASWHRPWASRSPGAHCRLRHWCRMAEAPAASCSPAGRSQPRDGLTGFRPHRRRGRRYGEPRGVDSRLDLHLMLEASFRLWVSPAPGVVSFVVLILTLLFRADRVRPDLK
jgi:hypothetical protein